MLVWPSSLFPLLVIVSVFQGGSVASNAKGEFAFGVPPFYFVASCIAVRYLTAITLRSREFLPNNPVKKVVTALLWFWALSVASSFILPRLFAGIPVYSPRDGLDNQFLNQATLTWSLSNMAQALFLSLCVICVLAALHAVRTEKDTKLLIQSLYVAILIVVVVGLWQGVALQLHWSFPYQVFNNNPGYNQGFDQVLEDWNRINSTFSEPSYAGAFLAATGAGLLAGFLRGKRTSLEVTLLLLVSIVLLETTATTGYVAFGATTCLLLVFFNPFRGQDHVRRFFARGWEAIFAIACVGAIFFVGPKLSEAAVTTSVGKFQGLSFLYRAAADLQAISVVRNTFGLGAGLGSNRPSSFLMALLSTVGILGTALFAAAVYFVCKAFPGRTAAPALQMAFWSFIALLIAQLVSIPEITLPMLWALFMIVLVQLNVRFTERSRASSAAPPPGEIGRAET
jgi:hypothetical protein